MLDSDRCSITKRFDLFEVESNVRENVKVSF